MTGEQIIRTMIALSIKAQPKHLRRLMWEILNGKRSSL